MNIYNCPRCGGSVRMVSIGWICERCHGFVYMHGGFHENVEKPFLPPMTNADRIRAMSDEELAKSLYSLKECMSTCPISSAFSGKDCFSVCCEENKILDWLKQPAEVET